MPTGRRLVEAGDHAAKRNSCPQVDAVEYSLEGFPSDIIEVHIDSVGTPLSQRVSEKLLRFVARGVSHAWRPPLQRALYVADFTDPRQAVSRSWQWWRLQNISACSIRLFHQGLSCGLG